MKKYWTVAQKTNDKIDCFNSFKEALVAIKEYEIEDKKDEIYEKDFYGILEEENDSI